MIIKVNLTLKDVFSPVANSVAIYFRLIVIRGFGNNGTEIPVKLSSYTIKGQRTGYSESLAGSRRGRSSPFFTSSRIKKEYLPGIWI